jgi:hypothetical protein
LYLLYPFSLVRRPGHWLPARLCADPVTVQAGLDTVSAFQTVNVYSSPQDAPPSTPGLSSPPRAECLRGWHRMRWPLRCDIRLLNLWDHFHVAPKSERLILGSSRTQRRPIERPHSHPPNRQTHRRWGTGSPHPESSSGYVALTGRTAGMTFCHSASRSPRWQSCAKRFEPDHRKASIACRQQRRTSEATCCPAGNTSTFVSRWVPFQYL